MIRSFRSLKRLVFFLRARRAIASYGSRPVINGATTFNGRTHLGTNTNFNGMTVMGCGTVTIGDNFHSGPECVIISDTHNYRGDAVPYDTIMIPRDVVIGDNVWLGMRVMVLGGVTIGEGAIIQAGSVVVNDIPALAIAGGHPARVFAYRDKEAYFALTAAGRFV